VPAKTLNPGAGEHRAGTQPGAPECRDPGDRGRAEAGCSDVVQAAALHQLGRLWPLLRDSVVRHAVNMLGYDKLNRWLSLLLATASKDPMAPALMYTALLEPADGVAGHRPGRQVGVRQPVHHRCFLAARRGARRRHGAGLDAMRLPEPICDALLGNGGRYQPFLELALASEGDHGRADRRAGGDARPDGASSIARNCRHRHSPKR
jgi:hypothetical protein